MMGRTHALSGAVGWLGGCAALTVVGFAPSPAVVVGGAVVSAGAALLPDVDHPGSTVARTLGPITGLLATGVAYGAATLRAASCRHCASGPDRGGHRAATHTILFAVVLGAALCAVGWLAGMWAGLVVVWGASGLAARCVLSRRRRGAFGAILVATFATGAVVVVPHPGWWWVGLPVAWGCVAHCLGDALTVSGCPLWWPLRIRGCRWRAVGSPWVLRFRTGGVAEVVVWWVLVVGGVVVLWWMFVVG
jgi:membrane-bound metal-dependent hydrolase YbcI (DUF457 family)